jgi:hypothetical protein
MGDKGIDIKGDVQFVIKRRSTSEEEETYRRKKVIDSVSLNNLQDMDSSQTYDLIAGVPKTIPIKGGPVKNIDDLTYGMKKPDEASLALFDQLLELLSTTSEIKYKSNDNHEKESPLLPTIRKAWSQYLYEYGNIEVENDDFYVNTGDAWIVISAIGKIINDKKLSDAFVKLQEEGEIRWTDGNPKLKYKAQSLSTSGLAVYVPDWPSNIRWELKKFDSFHDFHEAISKLIDKYRIEQEEKSQPSLILEKAYVILEKMRRKKHYNKNLYHQKETDLWSLYQKNQK